VPLPKAEVDLNELFVAEKGEPWDMVNPWERPTLGFM